MEQIGQELFAHTDISTLEQMRAMTFEEMHELFTGWMIKNRRFMMLRPNIDRYVLMEEFSKAAMEGGIADIPFMIGGCKDDMSPVMTGQSLYDLSIALEYRGRRPAYIYRFDRELPGDDNGAFHSAELWYVFGTLDRAWRPFTAGDRELSHRMINYWTNFMKNGDPNSEGLPRWDPYTSANPARMHFDL
jgi:para-nitrobenzyl esterase